MTKNARIISLLFILSVITPLSASHLSESFDGKLGKQVRTSIGQDGAVLFVQNPHDLDVRVEAKTCFETAELINTYLIPGYLETFWEKLEKVDSFSAKALIGAHRVEQQDETEKGLSLLESAHTAGIAYASYKLATFYMLGLGVTQNKDKALSYLHSNEKSPLLCLCLAQYYESQAVDPHTDTKEYVDTLEKALNYAEKSATAGNERAFAILMQICIKLRRYKDAAKWAVCRLYCLQPIEDFYEFDLIKESFCYLKCESIETMTSVAEGWMSTVDRKDDLSILRQALNTASEDSCESTELKSRFWLQFAAGDFKGFTDFLTTGDRFRDLKHVSAFHMKALTDLGYGGRTDFSSYNCLVKYAAREGHIYSIVTMIIHDFCCGLATKDKDKARQFYNSAQSNFYGLQKIDKSESAYFNCLKNHIATKTLDPQDSKQIIKTEADQKDLLEKGCLSAFIQEAKLQTQSENYEVAYAYFLALNSGPLCLDFNWTLGLSDIGAKLSAEQMPQARQKAKDLVTKFPTLRRSIYQIIMDYFYTNETSL